ncbi:MAG: phage baseplate assembly protein [Planctomycetota bacterium]|jgi:prophage tail gpP-like protein
MSELRIEISNIDDPNKINVFTGFRSYNIVNDLQSPANTFSMDIAASPAARKLITGGGQRIRVFSNDALQITSYTDEISKDVGTNAVDCHIAGRDAAGFLLDSAVPTDKLSIKNLSLFQIAQRLTDPWRPTFIANVVTDNAGSRYIASGAGGRWKYGKVPTQSATEAAETILQIRKKPVPPRSYQKGKWGKFGVKSPYYQGITQNRFVNRGIEAGDKVWDVLQELSGHIGAHMWMGVDASLVIGRPCYDFEPDAYGEGLKLQWDSKNNRAAGSNIVGVRYETSIANRASQYYIWGTGKPKKTAFGKELLAHTWSVKDPSPAFWLGPVAKIEKPEIIAVQNIQDETFVRRLARRTMEENALGGFSYEWELHGHHAPSGALWVTDSTVRIVDELNNITGVFYITKVERRFNLSEGKTTLLKLIPQKIWLHDSGDTSDQEYEEDMASKIWW